MSDGLLLVGCFEETHIGAHFRDAAREMGIEVTCLDTRAAFEGPTWLRRFNWWFRGRRPTHLKDFSGRVAQVCGERRPRWMVSTGHAPILGADLETIGRLSVQRLNFLTDDPWNPVHRADWFLKALPQYDRIYAPRRANCDDLRDLGCRQVAYLQFAYSPMIHFREREIPTDVVRDLQCEVLFAGGADADRVPRVTRLIEEGFDIHLYGGYWDRYRSTRAHARGFLNAQRLRWATAVAKVTLGFVRRANRDGHTMRSFEIPAMGGCMLADDTPEHREIFGPEGENTVYFGSPEEMIQKVRWLLQNEPERRRLVESAHRCVIQGRHTYGDRLRAMLGLVAG